MIRSFDFSILDGTGRETRQKEAIYFGRSNMDVLVQRDSSVAFSINSILSMCAIVIVVYAREVGGKGRTYYGGEGGEN